MALEWTFSRTSAVLSGILLVLLGLFVAFMRTRRPGNWPFALFALGLGGGFLIINGTFFLMDGYDDAFVGTVTRAVEPFLVVAGFSAVALALRFPYPLQGAKLRHAVGPAALATGYAAIGVYVSVAIGVLSHGDPIRWHWGAALVLLNAGMYFALHLFAVRARLELEGSRRIRTQYAILSYAFLIYPGYVAGAGLTGGTSPLGAGTGAQLVSIGALLNLFVLSGRWLVFAERQGGGWPVRGLVWLPLALPLVGLMDEAFLPQVGLYGVVRTVTVVVVAYGILRHQLLGIDLGVKWTIRNGALAGSFGVAYFVAAEWLEELVPVDGRLLGMAAAALLAIALHPLRHATQGIAERILPGVASTAASQRDRREESYRFALEVALENRNISEEETRHLRRLAEHLEIAPAAARRLEQEVRKALGVAADAAAGSDRQAHGSPVAG